MLVNEHLQEKKKKKVYMFISKAAHIAGHRLFVGQSELLCPSLGGVEGVRDMLKGSGSQEVCYTPSQSFYQGFLGFAFCQDASFYLSNIKQ